MEPRELQTLQEISNTALRIAINSDTCCEVRLGVGRKFGVCVWKWNHNGENNGFGEFGGTLLQKYNIPTSEAVEVLKELLDLEKELEK